MGQTGSNPRAERISALNKHPLMGSDNRVLTNRGVHVSAQRRIAASGGGNPMDRATGQTGETQSTHHYTF